MKESDIRPSSLYQKYLALSIKDSFSFFPAEAREDVPCFACGSSDATYSFTKYGFSYFQCNVCSSLFLNPRPTAEALGSFYCNSESSLFWAREFYPAVAETRRSSIFRPRVLDIASMCKEQKIDVDYIIDVGSGHGIFLDEWRAHDPKASLVAIEPSASLAGVCSSKDLYVIQDMVENVADLENSADLLVCFEVLEHVHNPLAFLQSLIKLVRPGGMILVTTLCIDGFDLQILWDRSHQIMPPHHINFPSVAGLRNLFTRAGATSIDILTPGKLDVDIVRNGLLEKEDNNIEMRQDPFAKFFSRIIGNDSAAEDFQKFLVNHQLSSHVWIYAKVS
jgi:SAM-dependent methyltransferase